MYRDLETGRWRGLFVVVLALSLTACGESESDNPSGDATDSAEDLRDSGDGAEPNLNDETNDASVSLPGDACDRRKESDVGSDCEVVEVARCYGPRDVDGDEIPGYAQFRRGTSEDGDELCDDVEAEMFYEGTDCSTVADCDGDGLNDDAELLYIEDRVGGRGWATKLDDPDSDGDGINDLDEIEAGRNPLFAELTDAQNTAVFAGRAFGYLTDITFAGRYCCTTQLGQGAEHDNELPGLLSFGDGPETYPVTIGDIQDAITDTVRDDDSALVFDFEGLPDDLAAGARNDAKIEVRTAAVVGSSSIEDRLSGEGRFSLDAGGAVSVLAAMVADGHVEASADELVLPIALSTVYPLYVSVAMDGDLAEEFPLTLRRVTMSFDVIENTSTRAPSSTIGVESIEDIRVAGAVSLEEIVAMHNALLSECYPDFDGPFIAFTESEDDKVSYIECNRASFEANFDATGLDGRCGGLTDGHESYCSLMEEVVYADTDTNDNGVPDSISVGFRFRLSGASRTE